MGLFTKNKEPSVTREEFNAMKETVWTLKNNISELCRQIDRLRLKSLPGEAVPPPPKEPSPPPIMPLTAKPKEKKEGNRDPMILSTAGRNKLTRNLEEGVYYSRFQRIIAGWLLDNNVSYLGLGDMLGAASAGSLSAWMVTKKSKNKGLPNGISAKNATRLSKVIGWELTDLQDAAELHTLLCHKLRIEKKQMDREKAKT